MGVCLGSRNLAEAISLTTTAFDFGKEPWCAAPNRERRIGVKPAGRLLLALLLVLGAMITRAPGAEAAMANQKHMVYPTTGPVTSDDDGGPCGMDRPDHHAYDVANAEGTGIYAAYAGTVTTGFDDFWGSYAFVTHYYTSGTKYQTYYAHLRDSDPFDHNLGANATRGERIGFMGKSGSSAKGVHLHFEIRSGPPNDPSFGDLYDDSLSIPELDSEIGCGKTWTAKAKMPMDFSSDLYVRMVWYLESTESASAMCFNYGQSRDFPLMGDWNGNGIDTPGVVQGQVWNLDDGYGTGADYVFGYGNSSDQFIAGDWNGDGRDTPGVVRGNTWYLRDANSTGLHTIPSFTYGQATDRFIVGDWDGNGTETPGVFRGKTWYLRNSNSAGLHDITFSYGVSDPNPALDEPTDDLPVTGNWDGSAPGLNAFDTHAVVRGNTWYYKNTLTGGTHDLSSAYGREHDTAVPIDRATSLVEIDTQAVARGSMETTNTC